MHITAIPANGYDGIDTITIDNKTYLRGNLSVNQLKTIVAYQESIQNTMPDTNPMYVSAVISCHINDIINNASYDYEQFLDYIAIAMCNNDLLMDIEYEIVGLNPDEKNTIYLLVSGDVSNIIETDQE